MPNSSAEQASDFDPEKVVDVYRQIIAKQDAATTAGFRKHYDGFARTLR